MSRGVVPIPDPRKDPVQGISPHFLRDVQAMALGREQGFWDHISARRILNEHYHLGLVDLPDDWSPPSDPAPVVISDLTEEHDDV